MSRHDVLAEFTRGTVTQYYDTDAMADEIVRLREELAQPLTHDVIMKRMADSVGNAINDALNGHRNKA